MLVICSKRAVVTLLAAVCVLGCGAATAAAEGPPAAGALVEFEYHVSGVKSVGGPGVTYTGGVVAGDGGSVQVQSGHVAAVVFANVSTPALGWSLVSDGSSSLTATVDDWRYVTSGTVTGTATLAGGASMTVTDLQTGHTTTVKNGSFSIPTGIGPLGATLTPPVNRIIRCRGGSHSCQAQINFAGGARRREIVIRLTASNLSLRSVRAASSSRHPVYRLSGGHFVLGGSEYVATLNAARSSPRGSHLILTFRNRRATAAAETVQPGGVLAEFDYKMSNAAPSNPIFPAIFYTSGVVGGLGSVLGDQTLVVQGGAFSEAKFLANAWEIIPSGGSPFTATLRDRRYVNSAAVAGSASVGAGSSMTVTSPATTNTLTLKTGAFSIPTGVTGLGVGTPAPVGRPIPCQGTLRSCKARINFGGGARRRQIVVRLTGTDFSLRSVKAVSSSRHPVYRLSGGHFVLGGSEYVARLNAARSSPAGSHLILSFRTKT